MPVKTTIIYEKHILHKNVVRFQKKKKNREKARAKNIKARTNKNKL